jgi:hypothetical protein
MTAYIVIANAGFIGVKQSHVLFHISGFSGGGLEMTNYRSLRGGATDEAISGFVCQSTEGLEFESY